MTQFSLADQKVLNNPVWEALCHGQTGFAERLGKAALYKLEVSPFAALETPDASAMNDLTRLCEPGRIVALWSQPISLPDHSAWDYLESADVRQMVCHGKRGDFNPIGEVLGADHVTRMVELVKLTNPGPFLERTIELGRYLGVMDGDDLLAMAGERFRPPGWTEVSGVCTHPTAAGRGYAAGLVASLLDTIGQRDDRAFLHVRVGSPSEDRAAAIYRRLGFEDHQPMKVTVLRRKG